MVKENRSFKTTGLLSLQQKYLIANIAVGEQLSRLGLHLMLVSYGLFSSDRYCYFQLFKVPSILVTIFSHLGPH